jgi:peptide/nickel transport system permease protein
MTMTAAVYAHVSRMVRATMQDVLGSSYVEMAILKGVNRRRIVLLHALPNAVGPLSSVIALTVGYLIGGVILVEVVFAYPGLARLMVDAVAARDVPVVQATTLFFAASYICANILADAMALIFNPRLRSIA